jgi:hypothetical protein
MSDRNDRTPTADELDELAMTADEQLDAEAMSDEPFPQGPNEDDSNEANPPVEATRPRTSDDDDLAPEGSGLTDTPFRGAYEAMARRNDLARRLEDLVRDAEEWARDDGSEQAAWIAETLADAYEQLDAPPEDTDSEADVHRAEASDIGGRSATTRGLAEGYAVDDE